MNQPKKNILIVTTAFSPDNAIGAIRISKLTKFLVRKGLRVTVISPEIKAGIKKDNFLECDELNQIRRIIVPYSEQFKTLFLKRRNNIVGTKQTSSLFISSPNPSFLQILKSNFFILSQFLYSIIQNIDWYKSVMKQFKTNIRVEDYDIVFTSYPSLGAHFVGRKLKRKYKLPWVSDYRDPINYNTNSVAIKRWVNKFLQNRFIDTADRITHISNDLIYELNRGDIFPKEKFFHLSNGFDVDDQEMFKEHTLKDGIIRFSYAGSLYGGKRNISILFKVLSEIINENKGKKDDFRFCYAGREFSIIKSYAEEFGLGDILIDNGYVTRKESMKIQSEADLIVIGTWNTDEDQGILTGKLFEAILLKKQIVAVVNGNKPNSEIRRLIESIRGGIVYEESSPSVEDDLNKMKTFIINALFAKKTRGEIDLAYNSSYEKFDYSNIVDDLITIINSSN